MGRNRPLPTGWKQGDRLLLFHMAALYVPGMTKLTGRAPGRPRGALNKASREQRERAAESGMLPHEFLLAVTRGETIGDYVPTFAERLEAAKAAAPFFAPKLSAVEADVQGIHPLVPVLNVTVGGNKPVDAMTDEELEALIRMHSAEDLAAIRAKKAMQ